jgi:hypothetical protein
MPRRPEPKDTPAKLARRMKRRWRIILLHSKGQLLGYVDAADEQGAEVAAAEQFKLDAFQEPAAAGAGAGPVTVLTLRRIRDDRFEVTRPDIKPVIFKTRVEARNWCLTQYEIGGRKKGTPAAVVATAELAEILERRPDLKAKALRR